MRNQNVRVEVIVDEVRIMKESYALYGVLLRIVRGKDSQGSEQTYEQHVFRRFSEFWELKKKLEKEFNAELPYELPTRKFGLWKRSAVDLAVIEERKVQLAKFLRDMLNDSFDTKWKNSSHVTKFLKLPANWSSGNNRDTSDNVEQEQELNLMDPTQWMISFKDSKTFLEQSKQSGSAHSSKVLMQLRLALYNMEVALKQAHKANEVGTSEYERRTNLLLLLKRDVNEMALTQNGSGAPGKSGEDEEQIRSALFPEVANTRSPKKPLAGRRRFGETTETEPLSDQQLLQLHKTKMEEQDQELEEIRKIVLRQKNISLEMNQELAQQNDLLDLLDNDVNGTATKLQMANRKAKQFNND